MNSIVHVNAHIFHLSSKSKHAPFNSLSVVFGITKLELLVQSLSGAEDLNRTSSNGCVTIFSGQLPTWHITCTSQICGPKKIMIFLYAHALKQFYSEKLSESLMGIEA